MNATFTCSLFLRMAHTSPHPSRSKMIHSQVSLTLAGAHPVVSDQGTKSQYDREPRLIDLHTPVA
jgi:hypothetical protein